MKQFKFITMNKIWYFKLCPGCCGIPLLTVQSCLGTDLCPRCVYERIILLIEKYEAERLLEKFPKDINVIKHLPLEKRIEIGKLLTILHKLNERKSNNGYKAETSHHDQICGGSEPQTFRTQAGISKIEEARI